MIKSYKKDYMIVYKIHDEDGQKLEMFANAKGKIYIEITDSDDSYNPQYITLNKEDAEHIMNSIQKLLHEYEIL